MFEHGRTLFLEEWFLSVLVLLALFGLGWLAWRFKSRGKRASAKPAPPSPSRDAAAATPHGQEGHRQPSDQDEANQETARLSQALEAVFTATEQAGEQAEQPACPAPSEEVQAMVEEGLKELDSFGLTFQKMRAFNDPNASLQQISEAITTDLVFSGKVLKTANSPYFGAPGQVSSLHHAVLVLGLNNLKTLYFQDHFRMVGSETGRMADVREQVWKHSITTAICASYLCKAFRLVPSETAFTLGLLHDLGKLVLADMAEQLEARGEDMVDFTPQWSVAQEQERFGVDHAWIAQKAAEAWNLPREVAMVIGAHHCMKMDATPPPSDAAKAQLVTLALANQFAHAVLASDQAPAPLPGPIAGKLHNTGRLAELVRDPKLLEELQMARVL